MKTKDVLDIASKHLLALSGHVFDVLTVTKPISPNAAANLAKIISKLSPLLGNLIEFNTIEVLNDKDEFAGAGTWVRQDPGFPDAIFEGGVLPIPGFEVKAWFPLSTEITARFKDSQTRFANDNTHVVLLAWMPDNVIFGKPTILSVCVASGKSIAAARDNHYHNPPDYIVLEPEDTTTRTANLQQTNTSGYKWQGTSDQFKKAEKLVTKWGKGGRIYKPTPEYQSLLRQLIARFPYRLDTNFAKIDRIVHPKIEAFKTQVEAMSLHGITVKEWARLFISGSDKTIKEELRVRLNIVDQDAEKLVK